MLKPAMFVGFVLAACFLGACGNGSEPKLVDGKEDFQSFYKKFYEDSIFQYQRIDFPLSGMDKDGKPKMFAEESWVVQKTLDPNDKTIQIMMNDQPEFKQEKILIKQVALMERHYTYEVSSKKWKLSYYAEPHLAPESNTRSNDSIPSDHPDVDTTQN